MVTVDELAERLGIGRNQAYEIVQRGQIPSLRFGRRWLIPRAAFDRMLAGETAA
jgi:excisionase family DNA binding protein